MESLKTPTPWVGLALAILIVGNVLGIAGTDLVLPAIPHLPGVFNSTAQAAQWVLASFVAGTALGLLLFGRLGNHYDQRWLLLLSLVLYAVFSLACAHAPNMETLIALRFFQGASGSAAVVFNPGFVRQLLHDKAVRVIGFIGSIESLVPAFAPLIGALLLARWGWASSFHLSATLALLLAVAAALLHRVLPRLQSEAKAGSYGKLLRNPVFMRYALSHAFVLGGLLTFVLGAPAVIVNVWQLPLSDFIRMQMIGVFSFIVAANFAPKAVQRFGAETMIHFGTFLASLSGVGLLIYGWGGGRDAGVLIPLCIPMNVGLGLRGPPGFYQAILSADGDDARGSALVILAIMLTTAIGTALAAPFIAQGLPGLATVSAGILIAAVLILRILPRART